MNTLEALLSHHPKEEQFKCLKVGFFGKETLLCSRCLGFHLVYYPLLIFFLLTGLNMPQSLFITIIFLLPTISYIDWISTKLSLTKSNNLNRLLSGSALGIAGATMTYSVITEPFNFLPYVVAIIFFTIAGIVYLKSDKKARGLN